MTEWVKKILALIKACNLPAAVAQIKATTSSKDLRQLQTALEKSLPLPAVHTAINDQLQALASPRLSRSP